MNAGLFARTAALTLLGASAVMADTPREIGQARLVPGDWSALAGWPDDDHASALRAFRAGCAAPKPLRQGATQPPALAAVCAAALQDGPLAAPRAFFEQWFQPLVLSLPEGRGFLTGYYEPEFPASLTPDPAYPTPLLGRPADLVTLAEGEPRPAGVAHALQAARRLPDGSFGAYPTRREIDEGALGPAAPVIAWLADPVDRFVMQVQGSARLSLSDGRSVRVAYAGRNGHPYTSLGRLMSQRENIAPAQMTMDRLVARLKADPDVNRRWIWENQSFVFFRVAAELSPEQGPIGGAGHPLVPGRSIAADRALWAYNLPVWLNGSLPTATRGINQPLRRLMVIQDTGSAIIGPARFDYFHGSGEAAGFVAGLTRHAVDAVVLWPKAAGPRP